MNRASFAVALKDERVRPKSTGGSKRTRSGVWLSATACTLSEGLSRPHLNYPGNLGRTCQRRIRTLVNARTETFERNRGRFHFLLAAVGGGRSHCIVVERVCGFADNLAFALQGLAH